MRGNLRASKIELSAVSILIVASDFTDPRFFAEQIPFESTLSKIRETSLDHKDFRKIEQQFKNITD